MSLTCVNIFPNSLVAKVMDALKMDSIKFNEIYDREKPGLDDEIIFSCLLGGRAQKGATFAVGLGYKKYICFMTLSCFFYFILFYFVLFIDMHIHNFYVCIQIM